MNFDTKTGLEELELRIRLNEERVVRVRSCEAGSKRTVAVLGVEEEILRAMRRVDQCVRRKAKLETQLLRQVKQAKDPSPRPARARGLKRFLAYIGGEPDRSGQPTDDDLQSIRYQIAVATAELQAAEQVYEMWTGPWRQAWRAASESVALGIEGKLAPQIETTAEPATDSTEVWR